MSCDFKPGDEVVCVAVGSRSGHYIVVGERYVLREVDLIRDSFGQPLDDRVGVRLVGITVFKAEGFEGKFSASLFRKVQKRDLTAWLGQTTTFEEPKRVRSPA